MKRSNVMLNSGTDRCGNWPVDDHSGGAITGGCEIVRGTELPVKPGAGDAVESLGRSGPGHALDTQLGAPRIARLSLARPMLETVRELVHLLLELHAIATDIFRSFELR